MATTEYKSNVDDFVPSDGTNILDWIVKGIIHKNVYTAFPVKVTGIERKGTEDGAGYVQVQPLIQETDPDGNGISVVDIPKIPYFRYQHGTCAIVCDPKIGDLGLAIVAKQDISNLEGSGNAQVPATHRTFDPSDSFYIGGFWGSAPKTFIHLEDDGNIEIKAPTKIVINSKAVEVNADETFTVNAPNIALNGAISGGGTDGKSATFTGTVKSNVDVLADSVSLKSHTHSGVQTGSGNTGTPNS